jgi:hypothetical protein
MALRVFMATVLNSSKIAAQLQVGMLFLVKIVDVLQLLTRVLVQEQGLGLVGGWWKLHLYIPSAPFSVQLAATVAAI